MVRFVNNVTLQIKMIYASMNVVRDAWYVEKGFLVLNKVIKFIALSYTQLNFLSTLLKIIVLIQKRHEVLYAYSPCLFKFCIFFRLFSYN